MAHRRVIFKAKPFHHSLHNATNDRHIGDHVALSAVLLFNFYDLSLIVSTEDLGITSNRLSIPQLPSPTFGRLVPAYRHRTGSNPMRFAGISIEMNRTTHSHALQRSATVSSVHHNHLQHHMPLAACLVYGRPKESGIDEIPSNQFEQCNPVSDDSISQKATDEVPDCT